MALDRLIIVDLTRQPARVRVTTIAAPASPTARETADLTSPLRVALRAEPAGLRSFAGEEAVDVIEDDLTIRFDDLHTDLLRLEDIELQSHLISAFWSNLSERLARDGWLKPSGQAAGYVIPHALYPPALLERFRQACAVEGRLKIAGFSSEAVSLLMGFLQSEALRQGLAALDYARPHTVCLVAAYDDSEVSVACFDYSTEAEERYRILLRDYFRTTCGNLSDKLKSCDWLGEFSALISLESPSLTGLSRDALEATLDAVAVGIFKERHQTTELDWLKIKGADYIANCSRGRARVSAQYNIETACHIGIQIDQGRFYPVITKDEMARTSSFPYGSAQAFKLQGHPGNEMRVNLYCGYSDRLEDATLLGYTTLEQAELSSLKSGAASAIAAVLRLDTHGGGEFTLGLMPDNRIINSIPFVLPGLLV
jgi:hypothetical protein